MTFGHLHRYNSKSIPDFFPKILCKDVKLMNAEDAMIRVDTRKTMNVIQEKPRGVGSDATPQAVAA